MGVEVGDTFNITMLNYSGSYSPFSSIIFNSVNYTSGDIEWTLNLTPSDSILLFVNSLIANLGNFHQASYRAALAAE